MRVGLGLVLNTGFGAKNSSSVGNWRRAIIVVGASGGTAWCQCERYYRDPFCLARDPDSQYWWPDIRQGGVCLECYYWIVISIIILGTSYINNSTCPLYLHCLQLLLLLLHATRPVPQVLLNLVSGRVQFFPSEEKGDINLGILYNLDHLLWRHYFFSCYKYKDTLT